MMWNVRFFQFLRNIIQGWVDYLVADMNEEEVQTLFKGFGELVSRACDVDLVKLARELPAGGEAHEKL